MTNRKTFRQFVEEISELVDEQIIDEEVVEIEESDYGWDVKEPKHKPQPTTRKIAGRAYGGAAQKDDDDEDDEKKPASTEKRGRGRPKGSTSGARQQGSAGKKSYGGLTFHSLNLPNSNK